MIDFHFIVNSFPGRISEGDCGEMCKGPHRCCNQPQVAPLAPGEGAFLADHGYTVGFRGDLGMDMLVCNGRQDCPGKLRPVVCRTYPIHPGMTGLKVDTGCSESQWLSWDFIIQMERMWAYLGNSESSVPLWISKLEESCWSKEKETPLYKVKHSYGDSYSEHFGQLIRPDFRAKMIDIGWLHSGDEVLDAGGGRGAGIELLKAQGIKGTVLDINPALARECGGIVGSVENIPFNDDLFDAVFCFDVLEHLDNPEPAVRELLRVSRDRVIIYVGTLESEANLLKDPTHRTFLPWILWLKMFDRCGAIEAIDYSYTGVLLRKNRRG